jgi:NCS1 family nucleobase:cation symporter-1
VKDEAVMFDPEFRVEESNRRGRPRGVAFIWAGVLMSPSPIIVGVISAGGDKGPGFLIAMSGLMLGYVLGASAVAWLSVWGMRTGMSQMALGWLAFGRANVLPQIMLIVSLVLYVCLNDLLGVSAITSALGIPFLLGLVFIVGIELIIDIFGIRIMRLISIVVALSMSIVVVFLLIGAIGQMPPTVMFDSDGVFPYGKFITAIALGLSNAFAWVIQAADISRELPVNTNPRKLFAYVFGAMFIPLSILAGIGAWISSASAVASPMGRIFEVLGGGFWATLALAAMAAALAIENSFNDLSTSITTRQWGLRVPARFVAITLAFLGCGLALLLQNSPLVEVAIDISLFAGYFSAPWFGILAIELVRRRLQREPWRFPTPQAWPAAAAFSIAYLVMLTFSASPLSEMLAMDSILLEPLGAISRYALRMGDFGYEAGVVTAGVLYLVFTRIAQRRAA